jgi:hypothetical protein
MRGRLPLFLIQGGSFYDLGLQQIIMLKIYDSLCIGSTDLLLLLHPND